MAYAKTRSVNLELEQGMIDGTYKQINPDRGGEVETATAEARRDLSPRLYGITEAVEKELPDGRKAHTPYTVDGFDIPKIDRRD